jgi:hypothetical protein
MEFEPPLLHRLNVSGPDYLPPLLDFFRNELAEVGGRTRKDRVTQVGKPCLDFWDQQDPH